MPTIQDIVKDPDFYNFPIEKRRKIFLKVDPKFKNLNHDDQTRILITIENNFKSQRKPNNLPAAKSPSLGQIARDMAISGYTEPPMAGNWQEQMGQGAKNLAGGMYRPALEGGGAAVGGLVGMGAGPLGGVAGGALGYGMGKRSADLIDEAFGIRQPPSLKELVSETGQDLKTGAMYEMGGQALAPAAVATGRGIKWVYDTLAKWGARSFKQSGMQQAAGEVLVANTSHKPIYAANADEAAAIEKEIPGLKFSMAQRSGDPGLIKLERTQVRSPGEGSAAYFENIDDNTAAIEAYYKKNFAGKESIDDVLGGLESLKARLNKNVEKETEKVADLVGKLPQETPQTAGMRTIDKIEGAKEPAKKAMGILEESIPDYPMKFENTQKAIYDTLRNKKMSANQIKAVESFEAELNTLVKKGESTHLAFGVRRSLNDKISKLFNSGDDSGAAALMGVKEALESDLAKVSDLARTGKIVQHKGKTIFPDELSKEFELNSQQIAKYKATKTLDVETMQKELNTSGAPTMQMMHESKKAFHERLIKDYKRTLGKEPPGLQGAGKEEIAKLSERNKEIAKVLREVEPGKDVAGAMKAYNDFASKEYFAKFDRGAVARVTRRGKEVYGTATKIENIPSQFNNSSGANDLINAIGKENAKDVMHGYYTYDMLQNVATRDGLIEAPRLNRWLNKNKIALQKYGLYDDYHGVLKAQDLVDVAAVHAKDFEKSIAKNILKADPERAAKVAMSTGNPGRAIKELMGLVGDNPAAKKGLRNSITELIDSEMKSATTFSKLDTLLNKYMPAIEVMYKGAPEKIKALTTMQTAYKNVMRNKKSPLSFGSDTAENVLTELGKANVLSRTANVAKTLFRVLSQHGKQQADDMITRALFDPEYAQTILDAYKYNVKPKDLTRVINAKVIQLDVYRNRRFAQAAAGSGLVIKGEADADSN